jgi:hypothetical protein
MLDSIRWQIVCRATQKHHGIQLRSAAFRLLVSMLSHVEEPEWQHSGRLVSWPSGRQIERDTGLREGSIGHARQQLIGCGLILPLSGAHKKGGCDPIAAYQIFTEVTRSPLQEEAARHVARLQHRGKDWGARRRAQLDQKQKAEVLDELVRRLNGG